MPFAVKDISGVDRILSCSFYDTYSTFALVELYNVSLSPTIFLHLVVVLPSKVLSAFVDALAHSYQIIVT